MNWNLITLMNRELLSCFFAKFKYYGSNLHNYPRHFICDCLVWWFHELCWGRGNLAKEHFQAIWQPFFSKDALFLLEFTLLFCPIHLDILLLAWWALKERDSLAFVLFIFTLILFVVSLESRSNGYLYAIRKKQLTPYSFIWAASS